MSAFVDIKPGQWVLAFHQSFGPYYRSMQETLEGLAFKHWMDSFRKEEIFFTIEVAKVMPSTFIAVGSVSYIREGARIPRAQVIASHRSEADALALRDKLFAIGAETGEAIEKEMYRRIEKFAARKRAAAERKIHRLLPHHFRSEP
jgi:hypothetical protein